ncbi:MAG: peptide ABC transporter substrate-binding protein [Candidatus Didemnitutus sp.]|nr:peptide ABC transporter substrate-binding protein [Candidatus Didemnitutus sp.]
MRFPFLRSLLLVWFSIGVIAGFSGCAKRETPVELGNRNGTLHRSNGYEVNELDPHIVTGLAESKVLAALFEGLVAVNPEGGDVLPGVAERWSVSDDGLTYTFFLRANARWSNGVPVTAEDFVRSWQRILTPGLAADNAPWFYVIHGAEAFHKGTTNDFSTVSVTASDARTLRVLLNHPVPYFLSLITNMAWRPVPLATIAATGDPYRRGNNWTRPERIVTNGPFTLKEWSANRRIVVEKSPTYWDAATVRLNAIHFYPFDNKDAEERAFRSGQLHVTDVVPFAKVTSYLRDQPEVLRNDPTLGTYFYRINTRRPALGDVRVRRALALAVDREAIVTSILRGGQPIATTFTPPGTAGYELPPGLKTDFVAARALLKEAGYEGGRGFPPIELLMDGSQNHRIIAETVQEMWRRELGIELRLVNQDLKSTYAARRVGDFQLLRSDWIGDFLDPVTFLGVWTSDSGNNYTGWGNATYDALLRRAALLTDNTQRHALFREAEQILLDEVPLIPIYHTNHIYLLKTSVKNWRPTQLEEMNYKYVWLEE